MFKRIIAIAFLSPLVLEASPVGFYIRPTGFVYPTDNLAGAIHMGYQFNRGRAMELAHTIWEANIKASDCATAQKLTVSDKHILPLNGYYNLYLQWGFSLASPLIDYEPFVGGGMAYHINRQWHFEVSWHHYELLSFLRKGALGLRKNSITMGVGYCFK